MRAHLRDPAVTHTPGGYRVPLRRRVLNPARTWRLT